MAKNRLKIVGSVFIVERVIPYDGSEIVGVYATLEAAQESVHSVKRWYSVGVVRDQVELAWQSRSNTTASNYDSFFHIEEHDVLGPKTNKTKKPSEKEKS